MADIRHFEDLTPEEIKLYNVRENTFLVHLFTPTVAKSFEIFIDEGDFEMKWRANSTIFIDPTIVEIIGKKIDDISY
jgi:hypothetical protein